MKLAIEFRYALASGEADVASDYVAASLSLSYLEN